MNFKPVSVPTNSILFCKYGVAILIWIAFITKIYEILIATFLIFLFSAILGINRAPMVVIFSNTIGILIKDSSTIVLDIHDMRFVHFLAAGINLIILSLYYFGFHNQANVFLLIFAILKSLTALGYCPASKLRKCVLGDSKKSCCSTKNIFSRNKKC